MDLGGSGRMCRVCKSCPVDQGRCMEIQYMVRGASWGGHAGDGFGKVHGDVQEVLQRSEGACGGGTWTGRVHG